MAIVSQNLKKNDNDLDVDAFRSAMLDWYKSNARELPWRVHFGERPDPYHEWLSEIMLQQTVVKAAIGYFNKFINLWPTIHDLADAHPDDITKEWAGLGYYARARNLHKCAQIISREYNGVFPNNEKDLMLLPGIGPYTSAAIRSIAFQKPSVVMDGNIERIMCRVFAHKLPLKDSKRQLYEFASYLSQDRTDYPGEYAQSLMDLGASVCISSTPKCMRCPIQQFCQAYKSGIQNDIPVKKNRVPKPERFGVLYFIENDKGQILFERRSDKGLLANMVGVPGTNWTDDAEESLTETFIPDFDISHTFTHFRLKLKGVRLLEKKQNDTNKKLFWYDPNEYVKLGLPTVFLKAVKQYLKVVKTR